MERIGNSSFNFHVLIGFIVLLRLVLPVIDWTCSWSAKGHTKLLSDEPKIIDLPRRAIEFESIIDEDCEGLLASRKCIGLYDGLMLTYYCTGFPMPISCIEWPGFRIARVHFYQICSIIIVNYCWETTAFDDLYETDHWASFSKIRKPERQNRLETVKTHRCSHQIFFHQYTHTNYLQAILSFKYVVIRIPKRRSASIINMAAAVNLCADFPPKTINRYDPIRAFLANNSANHNTSYKKNLVTAVEPELPIIALFALKQDICTAIIVHLWRVLHRAYCLSCRRI